MTRLSRYAACPLPSRQERSSLSPDHKILLRQEAQAVEAIAKVFALSEGERSFLLACPQGEGILILGNERAAVRFVASEREHDLATTKPEELEELEAREAAGA